MKKKIQVFCKAIVNIGIIAIALFLSSCGMMKESFLSAFNENPVSTDENVSKSNLPQAVISNNTETKGNAYQETEKYVVTATYLNVREKASSKSVKVGGLSKGDQVEVYGFKGNWAEIGFKGGKASANPAPADCEEFHQIVHAFQPEKYTDSGEKGTLPFGLQRI